MHISVDFRYFPKLSRYLYDHRAIRLAARYHNLSFMNNIAHLTSFGVLNAHFCHKFEIKQFLCLYFFHTCIL